MSAMDLAPPPLEPPPLAAPRCGLHAANTSIARCVQCGREVCHVCVFTFRAGTYCPECLTGDRAREDGSGAFGKEVLSLALAMVAAGITASFFVVPEMGEGAATVLTYPWLGATIGGVALALVARDGARRRGSVLPTIGLVANGVLLVVQLALTLIGNFSGK
jgi:predicted membrane channel-forming protein YqfA (hemolysin III family)